MLKACPDDRLALEGVQPIDHGREPGIFRYGHNLFGLPGIGNKESAGDLLELAHECDAIGYLNKIPAFQLRLEFLLQLALKRLLIVREVEYPFPILLGQDAEIVLRGPEAIGINLLLEPLNVPVANDRPALEATHDTVFGTEGGNVADAEYILVEPLHLRPLVRQVLGDGGAGGERPVGRIFGKSHHRLESRGALILDLMGFVRNDHQLVLVRTAELQGRHLAACRLDAIIVNTEPL